MTDAQAPEHANPAAERDLNAEEAQQQQQQQEVIENDVVSQSKPPSSTSTSPSPPPLDPNDPYNWPRWHKLTTYLTICLFSFMDNVNASNFTVATLPLRKYFLIDATHAVYLTALNVLMFGMGNLLWIPVMRATGKRPVYLLAILVLIFSNIWSTRAGSYASLLASRMVSGIGASAADATVPSAVAEMYDVRERGGMMMYFHIALASGIFLGPVINAYVVQEHGWRWSPAWIAIVSGVVFVLAVFLIHETQYDHLRTQDETKWKPRRRFLSYLSLHQGISHDHPGQKAFQAVKDIIIMTTFPPILFTSILVGVFVGWTIIIQVSIAQTFLQPPYLWTLAQVGLLHLAGWLGAICALYFGGLLIDTLINVPASKKNLPKRRLKALIIPFTIAPPGLLIYGICLAQDRFWIAPAVGYAMHSFGFVAVSNIVVTYAVDTYRPVAGEAMVVLFIVRNVIAVVCSIYCLEWIARDGVGVVGGVMAGVEWGVMLVGVPMFVWAGEIERFTGRYGPMKRLREEEEGKRKESAGGVREEDSVQRIVE